MTRIVSCSLQTLQLSSSFPTSTVSRGPLPARIGDPNPSAKSALATPKTTKRADSKPYKKRGGNQRGITPRERVNIAVQSESKSEHQVESENNQNRKQLTGTGEVLCRIGRQSLMVAHTSRSTVHLICQCLTNKQKDRGL